MTRTTPDFTSVACSTSGMSLFSALCMLSWVLPQALTEGDDLDLHLLAEVLVVLLDVGGVVERQVHHRRLAAVHLQDEVVRLLVDALRGWRGRYCRQLRALRRRRWSCEE